MQLCYSPVFGWMYQNPMLCFCSIDQWKKPLRHEMLFITYNGHQMVAEFVDTRKVKMRVDAPLHSPAAPVTPSAAAPAPSTLQPQPALYYRNNFHFHSNSLSHTMPGNESIILPPLSFPRNIYDPPIMEKLTVKSPLYIATLYMRSSPQTATRVTLDDLIRILNRIPWHGQYVLNKASC